MKKSKVESRAEISLISKTERKLVKRIEWQQKQKLKQKTENSTTNRKKKKKKNKRTKFDVLTYGNLSRKYKEDLKSSLELWEKKLPNLVLDVSFDDYMTDKEIRSSANQIRNMYAHTRLCTVPVRLSLYGGETTGILPKSTVKPREANKIVKLKNNQEVQLPDRPDTLKLVQDFLGEKPILDYEFEGNYLDNYTKDQLVYLSSESPNTLVDLDITKVYIIGGLVDHNRYKGLTYSKAISQGIQTARLPIPAKVYKLNMLTSFHVCCILVDYLTFGNWDRCFDVHIPTRKVLENAVTDSFKMDLTAVKLHILVGIDSNTIDKLLKVEEFKTDDTVQILIVSDNLVELNNCLVKYNTNKLIGCLSDLYHKDMFEVYRFNIALGAKFGSIDIQSFSFSKQDKLNEKIVELVSIANPIVDVTRNLFTKITAD